MLTEIRDETKAAITEVRRAVDELRPPAIDEVGLVGAIRQRAASLSTDQLVFEVHGPDPLPPMPAAVEVAAFRIASEAMTNVAKHSGASRCRVELVSTTSSSSPSPTTAAAAANPPATGVGWTSMTERAAELGGTCTISSRSDGGLVVRAAAAAPRGTSPARSLAMIRVLVADDHPAFRRGLELMLADVDDLEVVGDGRDRSAGGRAGRIARARRRR